jgi:hypothetical protein
MRRMENSHNTPEKNKDTVVFKRSHFYLVMVVFAFAAGILTGYIAWGRSEPVQQVLTVPEQVQDPVTAEPDEPSFTRYEIPTEGFPSMGPEDAEIVLVEFSDFQ